MSVLGLLTMGVNLFLGANFFRDHASGGQLPFSSAPNALEEVRTLLKLLLGVYGSVASL